MIEPGIYHGLAMADYLAMAAVSQGTLQRMLNECPKAAWFDSYLNPRRVIDDSPEDASTEAQRKKKNRGKVAHKILLEGNADGVCVIDPKDHPGETKPYNIPDGWTNKSIRTARDNARDFGKIPILLSDMHAIASMVAEALEFIDSLKDSEPLVWALFQAGCGKSEVTFVWYDDGALCRCRTDRIANDFLLTTDYKSSEMSVEPDRWGRRQMVNQGYYIGAAFYRRGIKALTGVDTTYVWLAQEQKPPYLCSLIGCDPASLALGDQMIESALRQWRTCVRAGKWPGYSPRVAYPELPAYIVSQWEDQEMQGEVFK